MSTQELSLGEVVESSWGERARRLATNERRFEFALTLLVLGGSLALAILGHGQADLRIALIPVIATYAFAFRVHYPMGDSGNLVPTEPLLVVMFATGPVAAVPLCVLVSMALSTLIGAKEDRTSLERLSCIGGDAAHSLGPAVVLLAAGHHGALPSDPAIWLLAFGAQIACDVAFSTVRLWVASGLRPHMQLRAFGQVALCDLALAPLGVMAALATRNWAWATIGLVPAVVLLDAARRERSARIERAHRRLLELDHERRRLQLAIRRVGEALAYDLTLDTMLRILTSASVEAFDALSGRASIVQERTNGLPRRVTVLEPPPGAGGLLDRVEVAALAHPEAVAPSGLAQLREGEFHALACRVGTSDLTVGVVTLARVEPFSEEERSLLSHLCNQASVAVVNVFRYEDFHRQALTDGLTGLANHRQLRNELEHAFAEHRAGGPPAALILLDIDNFKAVNDTYGHQFGDDVLVAVSRCLERSGRSGDLAARYGGEELAMLLRGSSQEAAREVAERVRGEVEAIGVELHGHRLEVTVSVGVAGLTGELRSTDELIERADQAMYRAKRAGKNRVEVAGGPAGSDGAGAVEVVELQATA